MTMDFSEKEVEYVFEAMEKRPITYHTISRDLKLSMNKSKHLLAQCYQTNKKRVCACFIATGTRGESIVIHRFETENDLNENLALTFDKVHTIQIYGLQLEQNNISPVETALEELRNPTNLSEVATYHELGLIKGPVLSKSARAILPLTVKPEAKAVNVPKPPQSKTTVESSTNKRSGPVYQSRKTPVKPPSGNVLRKEMRTNAAIKRAAESKPAYQYKSRKLEQTEPKERVVVADHEEVEPESDVGLKSAGPMVADNSKLESLFLDDDFTDDESDLKTKELPVEEESQPIAVVNDDPESQDAEPISAPTVPEDSIFRSFTSNSTGRSSATPEPSSVTPKETTVDNDGYFTLYKQTETAQPKKSAPKLNKLEAVKTNKSAKNDGKKKQASLMSFFGKR